MRANSACGAWRTCGLWLWLCSGKRPRHGSWARGHCCFFLAAGSKRVCYHAWLKIRTPGNRKHTLPFCISRLFAEPLVLVITTFRWMESASPCIASAISSVCMGWAVAACVVHVRPASVLGTNNHIE